MTLHWWMHWFWVTVQLVGLLASPLPSTTQNPKIRWFNGDNEESALNSTAIVVPIVERTSIAVESNPNRERSPIYGTSNQHHPEDEPPEPSKAIDRLGQPTGSSFRVAKAIPGAYGSLIKINVSPISNERRRTNPQDPEVPETTERVSSSLESSTPNPPRSDPNRIRPSPSNTMKVDENIPEPSFTTMQESNPTNPEIESDTRITWILTTSRTPEKRRKKIEESTGKPEIGRNYGRKNIESGDGKDLTVLPLRIEGARIKLVVNSSRTITASGGKSFSTRTFNGSEDIEIDQELAEPKLEATAASILQDFLAAGISESTRLSRARNAFTSDLQRDDREESRSSSDIDVSEVRVVETNESINREIETSSSPSIIDIVAIAGSCLATIILLSTMASLGFIMYRRKYLNPPQTLNSDKCSNPDSSGYIDDSTIRDNSEEMYSLDNDSFLNSLEAMTIQNYWTDSVKHTKL